MRCLSIPAIAGLFGFAFVQFANAADLPVKAPPLAPPPPPQFSWTGFYVNGGVGYGMYNADTVWTLPGGATFLPFTQTQGGRGWFGTVGIGYDYQLTDKIVAGVLGDYDFASIKGTIQNHPFTVGTMTENWAWAVGGRLGWLITPQVHDLFHRRLHAGAFLVS